MAHSSHTRERLHGLDHLRAFAILSVFLFHYFVLTGGQPGWLPDVAKFGWSGVDLFFVLSGFLISIQLFEPIQQGQPISFPRFFFRRFFRIVPAFLVVLAIYFCIPFFREKESLPPLWKFLTFTQNFGLNYKVSGTFSHAWSLCVEEHFYLFLPLILILLQRTGRLKGAWWWLVVLFLLGFAVRAHSYNYLYLPTATQKGSWVYWYQYIYYPSYNRLDGLLVGVSIAGIYRFLPQVWKRMAEYGNHFFLLGILVLTCAWFLCEEQMTFSATVFGFPLVAVGYGFLVISAVSETGFLYKWKSKVTAFIAAISYAVYLTHKGMIHMTRELFGGLEMDPNLMLVISLLTGSAGAFILYRLVEKPFMKWRNKRIDP